MRRCDWENDEFPDDEFEFYRGRIYLHTTAVPPHLSNGLLPDIGPGVELKGPRGSVDYGYADSAEDAASDDVQ